jgi:hypothetical protein
MRTPSLLILASALVLTLTAACRSGRGPQVADPALPPTGAAAVSTPALRPPPAPHCAQVTTVTACQEWTPLSPQPGFGDMLRLQVESQAPTQVAWSGLYLCGALPDELLTRHLGAGYLKVIDQGYLCDLSSPDQTRDVQLGLAEGPLESWLPRYEPDEPPRTHTTLHGREAITRVPDDRTFDGLIVDRDAVLSIPATAAFVIVVTVRLSANLAATDIHRPDPVAADRLLDELVAAVVDLSG